MFRVFHIAGASGGNYLLTQFAEDGITAIRERERLGLPASPSGMVTILIDTVCDRRAAESWPEELDREADLPGAARDEFHAMRAAGVIAFVGPEKDGNVVGLRAKFTCTPFELVQWRRAWHAERRAKAAEKRASELEKELAEAVEGGRVPASDENDDD